MPTLNWIGKDAVIRHHKEVPFRLLEPDQKLSHGDGSDGNLIVQGDNLHALKALLPKYAGRVKCIYIDPPYNTGNEGWIYNDKTNSPEINKWLGQTVGKEAEDLSRHDKWLCMMYPRLVLLKQFLAEDGVIFVSIDENEHRYAEMAMDEVFGATNRIETFIWKKSYGGGAKSKHSVNLHEYILAFARNIEMLGKIELPPSPDALKYYKFKDDKFPKRGPYRLQPLATNSMDERPNLRYPIPWKGEEIWPEKQWQWSSERAMNALEDDSLVIAKKNGRWSVNYKQYLKDEDGNQRGAKLYSVIDGIYTQHGTNEVKAIFGDGKAFDFPKPSGLPQLLISAISDTDSIILDSFAGSGTTAHAVLKQNAEDGGNRKFILVEMEEKIAAEITAERVRRVAGGYTDSKGNAVPGLGSGFQFCRLSAEPLFNEFGDIRDDVTFAELADFVWFAETGRGRDGCPQPSAAEWGHSALPETPLLGIHEGRAIYLLFNGILGDRKPKGGNILTKAILESLPPHAGPKVIYAAATRLGSAALQREQIVFKQTPYAIEV
jgi:DNA modification methylase